MDETALTPQPQFPAEYEEQEMELRSYFLILLRRRWIILSIVIFSVLLATVYSLLQTPTYLSTSVLYIDRMTFSIVPEVVGESSGSQRNDGFLQTQYKLLMSKSLGRNVVKRLNLAGAKRPSEHQLNQAADRALRMLRVSPVKDSMLCEISFITPDPKLSMSLANTWAEEYVKFSTTGQQEITETARDLLVVQIKELQAEITEKEKLLQDYSLERQLVKLDDNRSMSYKALDDLNLALSNAAQEVIVKRVNYTELQARGHYAVPEVLTHPSVSQLRSELATLEQDAVQKSKLYKPDYPEMVRLKSQIAQLKQRLDQEMNDAYRKLVAAARADYHEAVSKEMALQKQMEQAKQQTIAVKPAESSYDRLKLEIDEKKKLLESLFAKQSQTEVSADIIQKATTIRIVDAAELPREVYSPKIARNILFSGLLGAAAGVLLAFGLMYFKRCVDSAEDIERHLQLDFLGAIPKHLDESVKNNGSWRSVRRIQSGTSSFEKNVDLLLAYQPASIASEAFRSIRTSLLFSSPEHLPRSVLITSSRIGEGKTFVACNLAIALAQLDKNVVLIDADLRNPRIHRVWHVRNHGGLSGFLLGNSGASEIVQPSKVKGVSLIPSGARTAQPAELLASEKFETLLDELLKGFDHVIVDSPPLIPVTDSAILAAKCSTVLLVVLGGSTPRDMVRTAKQILRRSEADISGIVLNGIDLRDPYYYYTYYGKYIYRYEHDKGKKLSQKIEN